MGRSLIAVARIAEIIHVCRGQKVLLDADLAVLYGVETKTLNQAVRRNIARFPPDFMFQLTAREAAILKSQFVTSRSHGGRRTRPHTFTEQGIAMLSSILRSRRAILVNIEIMRTFVRLRGILNTHAELAHKLASLERKCDGKFSVLFEAIRQLMSPEVPPRRRIGFHDR
jgi:hypothetical protein